MSKNEVTASTQIRSSNTETENSFHNDPEPREKLKHKNPDIDPERTPYNKMFEIQDRNELLEKHYRERIDKHNKNNNSAARRYDSMDEFLESFEGKKVKVGGKLSKNARWATASQISYFGGKDSLGDIFDQLGDAGMPFEELVEAYSEGYQEYIEKHNEKFPTLPIYKSNLHFDETTPHSHDSIVVMGHTKAGRASDSIDNALGEIYGYAPNFKGKAKNMSKYREDNDKILFDSVSAKLEDLGEQYGVPLDFEFIRTGQKGSESYEDYKKNKDLAKQEADIQKNNEKMNKRRQVQNRNKQYLDDYADKLQEEKDKFDKEREEFNQEKADFNEDIEDYQIMKDVAEASLMGIFKHDPQRKWMYEQIKDKGLESFQYKGKPDVVLITSATIASLEEAKQSGRKIEDEDFIHREAIKKQEERRETATHQRVVEQDDGPEF